MGVSVAKQQRQLTEANGVLRENQFNFPLGMKQDPLSSHFASNQQVEKVMALDNDAVGRAADIKSLQLKSGAASLLCPIPLFGCLCWACSDNRDCCQVFPGGCTFCCECCECYERETREIHSANSHRLTLFGDHLLFERDTHDRPIRTTWITVDKYGRATHHEGERLRPATAIRAHIPLSMVDIEIIPMADLPLPLYVGCNLKMMDECCGVNAKPAGSVLAVRLNNNGPVLLCIDCGVASNAEAFKQAFEGARAKAGPLPANLEATFRSATAMPAVQNNAMGMFGNMGAMMMQQRMMAMQQQQMAMGNFQQQQQQTMGTTAFAGTFVGANNVNGRAMGYNTTNASIPTATATAVEIEPTQSGTAPLKEDMMGSSNQAAPTGIAKQLADLASLHASGALNDEEYQAAKNRVIGS